MYRHSALYEYYCLGSDTYTPPLRWSYASSPFAPYVHTLIAIPFLKCIAPLSRNTSIGARLLSFETAVLVPECLLNKWIVLIDAAAWACILA